MIMVEAATTSRRSFSARKRPMRATAAAERSCTEEHLAICGARLALGLHEIPELSGGCQR